MRFKCPACGGLAASVNRLPIHEVKGESNLTRAHAVCKSCDSVMEIEATVTIRIKRSSDVKKRSGELRSVGD